MNKTTPDKEKLREEFNQFCHSEALQGNLKYPTYNQIADWWLDKMEAQKASTIAVIDETIDAINRDGTFLIRQEAREALLSILRKEI